MSWSQATMREDLGPFRKGDLVAVAKSPRRLSLGVTYVVIGLPSGKFIQHVAESFAGPRCCKLVKQNGCTAGPRTEARLDKNAKEFVQ